MADTKAKNGHEYSCTVNNCTLVESVGVGVGYGYGYGLSSSDVSDLFYKRAQLASSLVRFRINLPLKHALTAVTYTQNDPPTYCCFLCTSLSSCSASCTTVKITVPHIGRTRVVRATIDRVSSGATAAIVRAPAPAPASAPTDADAAVPFPQQ